jgi:hypothetical protein
MGNLLNMRNVDSDNGNYLAKRTSDVSKSSNHSTIQPIISDGTSVRPITVRVTDRTTMHSTYGIHSESYNAKKRINCTDLNYSDTNNEVASVGDDDDDDFCLYVKRRPKVYYVGGFKPAITEKKSNLMFAKEVLLYANCL